jgi:hypothetical protein
VVKVVYIMGFGRSGSTIVGDILGQLPGWFHTGELRGLWLMVRSRIRSCSCEAHVRDCPFWGQVLASAWGDRDPETVGSWLQGSLQLRNLNRFLRADREEIVSDPSLRDYLDLTEALYASVARIAGARVIVDSSKRPHNAALLPFVRGVEPTFVHLVRDPRGVAFSRKKVRSDAGSLPPSGPATASKNWIALNLGAEMVRSRYPSRSIRLRYEDFAADPRAALGRILDLVKEPAGESPFLDDRTVELTPRHTLKGNPNRYQTGPIVIRRDDDWRSRLPARSAATVTLMTLPLLLRYRYPLRIRRPAAPVPAE